MPAVAAVLVAPCPPEARALGARCGYVRVPLDRTAPDGTKLRIWFERYRQRDRTAPPASTVVSLEGGPGYPASDGRASRVRLWRPVSRRRDLLLVDLRGTGRSHALACRAFATSTRGYLRRAGRCARELGPARDLYATAQAVLDLEDVNRALGVGLVDLYGDSYGSYAAQAFAVRFPERLRSLTLDGTYPLPGTDPFFADLAAAVRRGFALTCARAPRCPGGPDPVQTIGTVATHLRAHPRRVRGPDGDGNPVTLRLDERALAAVIGSGYYHYAVWRETLAAVRSYALGDRAPLARLAAETVTSDAGEASPASFSEALYLSVICHDYPQPWDVRAPVAERLAQYRAGLAARGDAPFAPVSGSAFTGIEYEGALACLRWPAPSRDDPPLPPAATYPATPTLVLNGDLDTITTSDQAKTVAANFPASTFVEVGNSIHVTALGDTDACASRIYATFVESLVPGPTSCAGRIAPQRVVPHFPRTAREASVATAVRGDGSTRTDRRVATVAAQTVADLLSRWWVNYDGDGVGLRGGTWSYTGERRVTFTLKAVRFAADVPVDGTVRWDIDAGTVRAALRVPGGRLQLRWSTRHARARASVVGAIDGRVLAARLPAP